METAAIDDSDIVILFGYVALQLEGTLAIKWKDEVMSLRDLSIMMLLEYESIAHPQ